MTKGGSFLCHVDYCESYRPSARRGTPPDTGTSHIGFRCAQSAAKTEQPARPLADGKPTDSTDGSTTPTQP